MQIRVIVALSLLLCLCEFVKAQGAGDINLGPADHECPLDRGVDPNPERCDQYFICYTDPTSLWQCREGLLFDTKFFGCNYPQYVDCGDRKRPDQSTKPTIPTTPATNPTNPTTPATKPPVFTCPTPDGVFPEDPVNHCSQTYFMCISGTAYQQTCPGNTVFGPNGACTTLENAGCDVPTTTPAQGFTCPSSTVDDFYPSPKSCNEYYSCVNGNAYLYTCPATLVYNPVTKMCDWPDNVPSCSSLNLSNKIVKKITSSGSSQFTCPESDGYYVNPTNCNHYFTCINGVAVGNICPAGLYYDAANNLCNYPALVDCHTDE